MLKEVEPEGKGTQFRCVIIKLYMGWYYFITGFKGFSRMTCLPSMSGSSLTSLVNTWCCTTCWCTQFTVDPPIQFWLSPQNLFTQGRWNMCIVWMVYSPVVRARGLEYGGREFESRSLHLKLETKLCEERGLSGCRNGLKTVPLAQALLSLKTRKNKNNVLYLVCRK